MKLRLAKSMIWRENRTCEGCQAPGCAFIAPGPCRKSVTIGTDDRTVFLEIPDLKPVMQMSIKYDLISAERKELRGEVVNTIHALAPE